MIELNRAAKPYQEIEEFADYELTQCIAYEMAVRNPKYKQQVDEVVAFYNANKALIDKHIESCNSEHSVFIKEDLDNGTFQAAIEKHSILVQQIDAIEVIPFDGYDHGVGFRQIEIFGKEFYEIIDQLTGRYNPNGTTLQKRGEVELVNQSSLDAICIYKRQKREGYNIVTEVSAGDEIAFVPLGEDDSRRVETIDEFYQYLNREDCDIADVMPKIFIRENFKRPLIKVDNLKALAAEIELDLSRPLDELVAYITHIKQDIDKNKKVLKAPIELFGEELQKADDILRMCTETKNGKEICFDGRKGITRTQKLADMFFIYDAVKQGAKELRIRTALSEYYGTIGKKTDMSDKTFRKYRDIAIDYIEKERYKELITGVKS